MGYPIVTMITTIYTTDRRRALDLTIARVLTPAQHTMVRELIRAETPKGCSPRAEDMMYWIRLNMPVVASRIEALLHPKE